MMKWTICGTALALLVGCAPQAWAQPAVPPIGGVPAAGGVPPLVAPATAPAAAAPRNLWSFFLPTPDQKAACAACKEKICASQIGQLLNNSLAPVGAFTGGLLGPCCPPFKQDDLKKPAESAEGAAAQIKKDEAEAKARVAAVKYLARVDCSYWPEAADALVNALRADKNECVRFAAAQALGSGCCCGKKTIVALSISAAASDRDGNPPEKSDRVRFAAQAALENCLGRCGVAVPVVAPAGEGPRERPAETPIKPVSATEVVGSQPVDPAAYYKRVASMSGTQVVDSVRQSLMSWSEPSAQGPMTAENGATASAGLSSHAADHSLFGLVASAVEPVKASLAPPGRKSAATASTQVVSVSPPAPTTPYQPKAIEAVGYQHPQTRAWSPNGESAAGKPALQVPVSAPALPSTLPKLIPAPSHFPPANGMDVGHMLATLREGTHPEQRVWAAAELAGVDGRGNPDVVEALVAAGQIDAAAAVRAQCVRSLVKMNADGPAVKQFWESMQNDADATVQQEARRALGNPAN